MDSFIPTKSWSRRFWIEKENVDLCMHESKHGVMKIKYAERSVFVRFILLYPNLFCVYVEIILASQLKHK